MKHIIIYLIDAQGSIFTKQEFLIEIKDIPYQVEYLKTEYPNCVRMSIDIAL